MKVLHVIAFILVIIGGLNWLLTGIIGDWSLATYLGVMTAKIVYILVGVATIVLIATHKKDCKCCVVSSSGANMGENM